jgi:hypothetical protein
VHDCVFRTKRWGWHPTRVSLGTALVSSSHICISLFLCRNSFKSSTTSNKASSNNIYFVHLMQNCFSFLLPVLPFTRHHCDFAFIFLVAPSSPNPSPSRPGAARLSTFVRSTCHPGSPEQMHHCHPGRKHALFIAETLRVALWDHCGCVH